MSETPTSTDEATAPASFASTPEPDSIEPRAEPVIGLHPFEFLSGTAGTGKTWQARLLAEQPGVALTATTGIAACNLGEGTTINALISYYDTNSLKELFLEGRLQSRLKALRKAGLRRIVLDEVSMLDANQLTYLVRAIDECNQPRQLEDTGTDEEVEAPPPIGMTLVGDMGQLSPVKAPYAFESPEWDRFADHTTKLTHIYRQQDRPFIEALQHVRMGRIVNALDYFTEDRFTLASDDGFDGTTIFAKNDSVDRYNQLRLDRLDARAITFTAERWGKQAGEWKQVPDRLSLKEGALVMVLANRRQEGEMIYANGDLGELVTTGRTDVWMPTRRGEIAPMPSIGALVRLQRTGEVVMVKPVRREILTPLEPGRRKELKDQGRLDLIREKSEVIGTCVYMPLRCAYASTVHKSQGLSLDRVQINLFDGFFGAPQMCFVALSRARTPEGLRLVGTAKTLGARISIHAAVVPWL